MKIYLQEILEDRDHKVIFSENDEWFRTLVEGLDETRFPLPERTLSGEAALRRVDDTYLLDGKVNLPASLCCSRCAQDVIHPVQHQFHLLFKEGEVDDSEIIPLEHDYIELDDIISEQISLQLPLQPLCREDCKGLCDQCGADMNTQSCQCVPQGMHNQPFAPLQTQLQTQLKKIKTL